MYTDALPTNDVISKVKWSSEKNTLPPEKQRPRAKIASRNAALLCRNGLALVKLSKEVLYSELAYVWSIMAQCVLVGLVLN